MPASRSWWSTARAPTRPDRGSRLVNHSAAHIALPISRRPVTEPDSSSIAIRSLVEWTAHTSSSHATPRILPHRVKSSRTVITGSVAVAALIMPLAVALGLLIIGKVIVDAIKRR